MRPGGGNGTWGAGDVHLPTPSLLKLLQMARAKLGITAKLDDGAAEAPLSGFDDDFNATASITGEAVSVFDWRAAAPYKYEPAGNQSVLFGFRSPSNIIMSRTDGFYYATVEDGWGHGPNAVGQEDGACLMRTRAVTDPNSWRAWDGKSFNVSLEVNPYTVPKLQPEQHIYHPLTKMTYPSLLWSSYLKRFLIFGTTGGHDNAGWSFQLIKDAGRDQRGAHFRL